MASHLFVFVLFTTSFAATVLAVEPFCVANFSLPVNKDGFYPCKDLKFLDVNDFLFSRLQFPPATTHQRKPILTQVFDSKLPGLNTLGISTLLFNAPMGYYARPHIHYQASEIFTVLHGTFQVNLNTSAPENRQFTKVLEEGDVFVIPKGLPHSALNIGNTDATSIATFNCQNPDTTYI